MRIETIVHEQAYRDLVLIAKSRGLSLAALMRTTLYEVINKSKWGASTERDGRSIRLNSDEEVDRG